MVEYLGPTHQQVLLSIFKWRPIPTRVANSTPIQRYRHCRHPHQKMHWLIPKACSWNGEKASGLQKMTPVEQNKKATTTYHHSYKESDCDTRRLYAHPKVSLGITVPLIECWSIGAQDIPKMVRSCAKIKLPHHLPFSPKIEMQHKSRSCGAMFRQTFKKHCVNITNSVST